MQWIRKNTIDFGGFVNAPQDVVFQTAEYNTKAYECDDVRLEFSTAQPWPKDFVQSITGFNPSGGQVKLTIMIQDGIG